MPKISSITTVSVPTLSDKLIGTSVGGTPNNQTNNFTLQQLKTLFDGGSPPASPNLQSVLNAGNTAAQSIYLTGTIEATNLEVLNDSNLKNLYLSERLFDKDNSQGTNGQYLTSTGAGVQWSTLTISIPTLQQVLTAGNVSDKNITTTGNIQGSTITGTNLIANSNLRVVGTLSDSTNSVGASGQVLSSTVTGTDWVDLPSYSAVSPLIYNNTLKQFSIQQATSTQNGYLSSADWITFDGKQNAGNYITALTGEATASGPGSATITLNNMAVINKTLTGLSVLGGTITATDSIITAFGKLQNQINGVAAGLNYQGVWNAFTNTPTLVSSVGANGDYYVVDVAGSTNLNGITDWKVGDWAIFNGSAWQKIDNTDSVVSVNGQIGIVVLDSDEIGEGTTNLYYTNTRARNAISSLATGLTYTAGTGVFSLTAGYSIPTIANQTDWTTAYNNSITSAAVTGTTTKTLTLTQQDGGTITASWTDIDTGLTSVGVSMPSAFSVSNSPLTSNGTIAITGAGNTLQYIDGTGALQTFPSLTGFVPYIGATATVNLGYNQLFGGSLSVFGPSATQGGYLGLRQTSNVVSGSAGYTSMYAFGNNYLGFQFPQSPSGYRDFTFNVSTITPNVPGGRIYNMPDADGTLALTSDIPAAGLTSVGLSMPSAFSVSNSPLTSNGTIAVTGAGLASQYVRGDGTLANFPTNGGGGSSVNYYLNGSVSQGTFGGAAYYQMSKTPILGAGTNFTRTNGQGNGYIASFITNAGDPSLLNIPGGNWNLEFYFNSSASGGSPSFYGEIYKVSASNVFTLIGSGAANPEGITNGTTVDQYFTSIPVPQTSLLTTDRLAIRVYVITDGRTITLHTEDNNLSEVLTTISTGLTALNGLTAQVQYFQVGTSGTDFNISSLVDNHTFNLPTASAANRGALSSADWTTFNSKQNTITLTTTGTSGAATLIGDTLNIPNYAPDLSGYVTLGTDQTITGLKTILRGGDVLNFKIGTDTLYGLKLAYNQNELVPSGEATWSFVNTFNNGSGVGIETTPISFFRGVLVTGQRLLSASVNSNLLDYYGNNPTGRYPVYAYNTGVQQFASSIIVGETAGVVNPVTGAIADLPAGVVANFNGRVIGSNAVNSDEFVTLGQISGGTVTSVAALTLGTTGTDLSSTVANSTTTPVITLNVPTASATNRGALSAADWTTFNNKTSCVGTVTSVGLSSATSGVTIGSTPVTTSGTITLAIATASGSQNGLLSSTDWTTFNGKTSCLGTITSVTATSPLSSSGGTTPNITIQQASGSQSGFLSSTDWTTFNNKTSCVGTVNTLTTTGTGAATLVGNTLNIPTPSASASIMIVGGGTCSTLRCGSFNAAAGGCSTVSGGARNTASCYFSTVGGGCSSTASGYSSTVAGGCLNTSSGYATTVGGGLLNCATARNSTVSGGHFNTASQCCSTVSGGYRNKACANYATVGGGQCNMASGVSSNIGGGFCNTASSYFSTVGGGFGNTASASYATVGGGYCNTSSGYNSAIGGGFGNTASGYASFVGGGQGNTASQFFSGCTVVVGGAGNNSFGDWSSIVGGQNNCITTDASRSFIGGGGTNCIDGSMGFGYSSIVGGQFNIITGCYSGILGGRNNTVSHHCSFIIGSCLTSSANNTTYVQALSKTSGTFRINHPDPAKTATHYLQHSFVESPTRGDNIYRYKITTSNCHATLALPDYYKFLNEDDQVFVTPNGHFGSAYGVIDSCQNSVNFVSNADGEYNVLIIGTRKDIDAKNAWQGVEILKNFK